MPIPVSSAESRRNIILNRRLPRWLGGRPHHNNPCEHVPQQQHHIYPYKARGPTMSAVKYWKMRCCMSTLTARRRLSSRFTPPALFWGWAKG